MKDCKIDTRLESREPMFTQPDEDERDDCPNDSIYNNPK